MRIFALRVLCAASVGRLPPGELKAQAATVDRACAGGADSAEAGFGLRREWRRVDPRERLGLAMAPGRIQHTPRRDEPSLLP